MTTATDDTLNKFIEKLQQGEVDGFATGSGRRQEDAMEQELPESSQQSDQKRINLFGRVATALIVLLLIATGASFFLYRADREAVTSRLDSIVRAPLDSSLEERFLALEKEFVDASSANEKRLQAVDQRLTDSLEAQEQQEQQLQDMEQRLLQTNEPLDKRLQRVERRLVKVQPPDVKRLQVIESSLAQITARMDDWSAVMADLSNDEQSGTVMHAATVAEPPAARPIEPVVVARDNVALQLPQSVPKQQSKPATAAVQAKQGDWIINIGSYVYEKTAARKLDEFRKKGVTAELVSATVRGKTIYRVQVPGFDSMAEASSQARRVRETLGLEETWIRRR